MKRQACTPKGLEKRLRDLALEKVADPRRNNNVRYPLSTLLNGLVAAMVTLARSLRKVEERTGQMADRLGQWMGLDHRVADNTFGKVLPRLQFKELVGRLHAEGQGRASARESQADAPSGGHGGHRRQERGHPALA
jgi:hypothetical protein